MRYFEDEISGIDGSTATFVGFWTQFLGLGLTTPSKNAFLSACYCLTVPFIWWVVSRRRPPAKTLIAAAICTVGIGLVSLTEGFSISLGDGVSIASAFLYGGEIVIIGLVMRDNDILTTTVVQQFTSGFLALLLAGIEVSVVSLVGFVMLVGVIVNNGIVLVDYINQLRLEGMGRREAIIEAGVTRLRPILMTSLTTILGLVVMAFGKDVGTALMQPVALVCIGGLLSATLMTLLVVPCMYDILSRRDLRKVNEEELQLLDL